MTMVAPASPAEPPLETREFYTHALEILDKTGAPYVVGGGYAMAYYTGIVRHTKDLDVFIMREDRERILDAFVIAGYQTELTWPHFLVKALHNGDFVDLLYNSGNGLCPVDQEWFTHANRAEVLGHPAPLCPPEEMIWSKGFVQDRNRFDGADINHLLLSRGHQMDWQRLVRRFKGHEGVLLAHLTLFNYAYPGHRDVVPRKVLDQLFTAANQPADNAEAQNLCFGTNISYNQYLHDIHNAGFTDARIQPHGPMTEDEVTHFGKH